MVVKIDNPGNLRAAIAAAEEGEEVTLVDETGQVKARLVLDPAPPGTETDQNGRSQSRPPRRKINYGWLKGDLVLHPGWDDSIDLESGDL